MTATPRNIVLDLDLATPHRVPEERVRRCLPADDPEPRWIRATDHGAVPTFDGTPVGPDGRRASWRPFLMAIDRMMEAATPAIAAGARVWVTGRGGLPAFFYLGRQLQFARGLTFVHAPAPRDDVAPVEDGLGSTLTLRVDGEAAGAPYFEPTSMRPSGAPGHVALVVRTQRQYVEPDRVRADLGDLSMYPLDVVDLVGHDVLAEDSYARARDQLRATLVDLRRSFPNGELALFLAGPTHLALLAGVLTVVNTYPRVMVFEHDRRGGGRYRKAYGLPRGPGIAGPHKLLCVEATPRDRMSLQVNAEVRDICEKVRGLGPNGFVVEFEPAMRPPDLGTGLLRHEPRALHIAAHGRADALVVEDHGGLAQDLPIDALAGILRAVGDSVELVTLSACHSAAGARTLAAQGTTAIGFEGPVHDRTTLVFSPALYAALAQGRSVRQAFDLAAALVTTQPGPAAGDRPVLCAADGVDPDRLSFDPEKR